MSARRVYMTSASMYISSKSEPVYIHLAKMWRIGEMYGVEKHKEIVSCFYLSL